MRRILTALFLGLLCAPVNTEAQEAEKLDLIGAGFKTVPGMTMQKRRTLSTTTNKYQGNGETDYRYGGELSGREEEYQMAVGESEVTFNIIKDRKTLGKRGEDDFEESISPLEGKVIRVTEEGSMNEIRPDGTKAEVPPSTVQSFKKFLKIRGPKSQNYDDDKAFFKGCTGRVGEQWDVEVPANLIDMDDVFGDKPVVLKATFNGIKEYAGHRCAALTYTLKHHYRTDTEDANMSNRYEMEIKMLRSIKWKVNLAVQTRTFYSISGKSKGDASRESKGEMETFGRVESRFNFPEDQE